MFDADIVEHSKGRASKITEFWMISLALQFANNDDRDDDFVLSKAG